MTLKINKKTTQFFIAISKIGDHSFIMLGTHHNNKVDNLLCRVGKALIDNKKQNLSFLEKTLKRTVGTYNALFSTIPSKLGDEGITRKKKKQLISYHAYDMNYGQYLEFIKIIESLQTPTNRFLCYKPWEENGDEVTLDYTDFITPENHYPKDLSSEFNELNINKTCRHTAISLVQRTLGVPVSDLVSTQYFMDLPYKTTLYLGKPTHRIPFYVLPASPNTFTELTDVKRGIVEKLYRQMEHMLLIEPNSEVTQKKFTSLKELYTDILGPQKQLSIDELLSGIQNWKLDHQSTLNVLRKTYFWDSFFTRESRTMKVITEIEQDLKPHV